MVGNIQDEGAEGVARWLRPGTGSVFAQAAQAGDRTAAGNIQDEGQSRWGLPGWLRPGTGWCPAGVGPAGAGNIQDEDKATWKWDRLGGSGRGLGWALQATGQALQAAGNIQNPGAEGVARWLRPGRRWGTSRMGQSPGAERGRPGPGSGRGPGMVPSRQPGKPCRQPGTSRMRGTKPGR